MSIDSTPAPQSTAGATPAPGAGWYADPYGTPTLRYWDGRAWTGHTNPYPTTPAQPVASTSWQQANPDELFIRRVSEYSRWSGVGWMILGALQVLSIFGIIAGVWNLIAGWSRISTAKDIAMRNPSIPARFRPVGGYVVIAVVNLFLGGFIGLALVGFDLFVRDQILKNEGAFTSPTRQLDAAGYGQPV
ncbi:DUF5362 family protein [Pedococcus sp. KACC 23699]|uniref:DUF5362 family protein n=1 Tax=Pedococcus sp. KACC 23699 TaxID=3149228 RepID=A0AAU7JYR0_9MICO